jgi:hypothetical protein
MSFLRRRRLTLAIVVLQVMFFWIVAGSEHYRWIAEKHERYKLQEPDSERFGYLTLERRPVKPQPPRSENDMADDQWSDGHYDPTDVILVKILDFPVVLTAYIAVKIVSKYSSQVKFFYVMMTAGIALYWYFLCSVAGRISERKKERQTVI